MAIALILPIWRVKLRLRLWGCAVGFPGLEEEHKTICLFLTRHRSQSFFLVANEMSSWGVRFLSCPQA